MLSLHSFSLKALVRDSVLEYRRALLPHHHTNNTNNTSAMDTGGSVVNKSFHSTHADTNFSAISNSDAFDPVMSYLLTGRSVKIVGVRTVRAPPRGVQRGGDGGSEGSSGGSSGDVNKENSSNDSTGTMHVGKITTTTTGTTSLTLASYNGGGVTTNADYLSAILLNRNTMIASVKSSVARCSSDIAISVGSAGDSEGNSDTSNAENVSASTSTDIKQSLIDKVSRVTLHRTTTTSRAPHTIPPSELVHYTTATTKLHVSLLHRLKAQLHTARADSATFVLHTHALHSHLHYLRDVFFLGMPDFYAPIRELCLSLTEWKSSAGKGSSGIGTSSVYRNSTTFIGEAIAGTMLEKAPVEGIRHLSVVVNSSSTSGSGSGSVRDNSTSRGGAGSGSYSGVASLEEKLNAYLTNMSTIPISNTNTSTTNTHSSDGARTTDSDVSDLFSIITTMNIDILHHYPLTHFIDATLYPALNNNMRFLLLLTASRWTAEYWWMDVISNHSLNTTSHTTSNTTSNTSAPPSPTKLSSPMGHGAIYGTSGTSGVFTNPMRTTLTTTNDTNNAHSIPTTPTKANTTNATHYLADVLQAKRNCRAGLAVWLHTITAVNNVFMAHIHRTLWPAFETSLSVHSSSLLHM